MEIPAGKICKNKVIIFSKFAEMCRILHQELQEHSPLLISGEVSSKERQEIINEFNYNPKYKILIMTEAGTFGLNIQSCSFLINYDLPWSVSKMEQREGRAHRIGQTKSVTVYNLIARNTIDEYVVKVLHKKQKMSVDILKDDERLEDIGFNEEDIKAILRI